MNRLINLSFPLIWPFSIMSINMIKAIIYKTASCKAAMEFQALHQCFTYVIHDPTQLWGHKAGERRSVTMPRIEQKKGRWPHSQEVQLRLRARCTWNSSPPSAQEQTGRLSHCANHAGYQLSKKVTVDTASTAFTVTFGSPCKLIRLLWNKETKFRRDSHNTRSQSLCELECHQIQFSASLPVRFMAHLKGLRTIHLSRLLAPEVRDKTFSLCTYSRTMQ